MKALTQLTLSAALLAATSALAPTDVGTTATPSPAVPTWPVTADPVVAAGD
ncbi:hypothetical protein [Nocardioides sp. zg-DK7169]|uniref:hypothetical protein n=1 Tax=Nocardioides sp. zg-DK7169 TaxID=2736600 RepID=UPI0015540172|nr:hypothetical protein [Nocardioides sp. zg-DK7169]NPC96274.1 hypothetical protein [Nocardioides sp. zg-DK7169]